MTISDILLMVFSLVALGGLYCVGRYSKNARRENADKIGDR
jgi:hypothetical protein